MAHSADGGQPMMSHRLDACGTDCQRLSSHLPDVKMDLQRPLRILHVMDSLGEGGAEQNLLTLVRQLRQDQAVNGLAWLYDDDQLKDAFRPHVATMVPL